MRFRSRRLGTANQPLLRRSPRRPGPCSGLGAGTEAIENVPANQNPVSAAAVMGPYYPRIAFCPLATLARGGPGACGMSTTTS